MSETEDNVYGVFCSVANYFIGIGVGLLLVAIIYVVTLSVMKKKGRVKKS